MISLVGQPRDAHGAAIAVAGRTLALRQLDFALAAQATGIVALGDGASPEALALRHAAERAGARFQTVRDGHGLLGLVRANDELLVLAPGLLPEAGEALETLSALALLVLPAGAGVAAGFERIDLERAWAGAMVVPGGLIERLAELPAESDPAPALLRIALQAKVPEGRLAASVLADGNWAMVAASASLPAVERAWLERNVSPSGFSASEKMAQAGLRRFGGRLLNTPRSGALLGGAAAACLAIAVTLGAFGLPGAAFALVAVGAAAGALSAGFGGLRQAPFPRSSTRLAGLPIHAWLADLALAACGALAIEGDWLHRLFAPLALIGALRASRIHQWNRPAALLGDRAVLALLLALPAALGLAEPAIMLAALAILTLHAAQAGEGPG